MALDGYKLAPEADNFKDVYFKPPARVIVVDDSHLNRSFISNAFLPPNYEIFSASDGEEGLEVIKQELPELILLDVMMPGMNGFEVAEKLKEDPETADIPIIFITALDAIKDKLKAFDAGAVDFVTKPFNHQELIARVKTNIELRRVINQKERIQRIAMEERRNSAIARIAAGVSHNFNNMLGVSFGNIMLIESIAGKDFDPMVQAALADVKKSLERMQTLVKQFLVLANRSSEVKGGTPHPSAVNLKSLVEDVIGNLTAQKSNAPVPLEVHCDNLVPDNTGIYFDPSHLREVFQLILSEVIDTTVGKATMAISSPETDKPNGVECVINVKGIPLVQGTEDAIFEPFALPIANVGSGLSFSVAKHLVELNRGTIDASFLGDEELQFNMTFPKTPPENS